MNVVTYLHDKGVAFEILPHSDTFDAQHLAHELHVCGEAVAKTVLLRADHGFRYLVAVLPATKRIDFAAASKALGGSQLELASESELAEHCPDCEIGVLPPFGSAYGMTTLVDESLAKDDAICFEANTHHEAVRMKFEDFRRLEEPILTQICNAN